MKSTFTQPQCDSDFAEFANFKKKKEKETSFFLN